ncbi:ImmA/IrrE family metallo-endopeptidase [Desulfosporosinus sp. OT]|uniref:ImmA/IrrE family metallo-endopeptidase n=1 Tax=Desulfosporosinus sp. OT TaxID=913865 RepID=UPI001A98DBE8|nr:ImmA/IrrE family metallo-endopeptidase [Desulfosporosinus sp. OT]
MFSYLPHADYPLNLIHVAVAIETKFDIEVIMEECDCVPREITAQLACSDWVAYILINKFHHLNKKRFGICHEFGHLLLEHKHGNLYPGSSEPDEEKDEANNFAAALLMPSNLVYSLARRYSDNFTYLIQKMTQYFKVSTEAAARRLVDTDYMPGLIALVDPYLGRLNWEYHSPSLMLDRESFREFLVQYFAQPKKREENLEIMGYPFKIEAKRIWGNKYLLACVPYTMSIKCLKESASGYSGK